MSAFRYPKESFARSEDVEFDLNSADFDDIQALKRANEAENRVYSGFIK